MNLERFLAERAAAWAELESLVARAGGRPQRLGGRDFVTLSHLYRGAAADLSLARRRWPSDPIARRLEDLVSRARPLVYARSSRTRSVREFFGRRYWRLVVERKAALAVAALLLFAPMVLATVWGVDDPGAATTFVPGEFSGAGEPRTEGSDLGLSGAQQAAFSSQIFTNNIRVTFLAFAGGILLGLGTAAVLLFNGVVLGAVAGLSIGAGNSVVFFELVTPHGVLELTCIVVAAAAGMSMGWSLVDPGPRKRTDAVVAEGGRAVEIVLGTAPWLVLAGLVEGFVTPKGLGLTGALVVGFAIAAVYWTLLLWRGRRPAEEGVEQALETGAGFRSQVGVDAGRA